jgi:hypothetical protein
MKGHRLLLLVLVFSLVLPAYASAASQGYIRISLIEGDVQTKTPDSEEWVPSSINAPLQEGDEIWVPEGSRVELQLNDGTYIRLDEDSAMQILSTERDSSQFYLSQGYAYVYFEAPQGSVIQLDTPDASVRAYDNAVFRVDMPQESTMVSVYMGYVDAENRAGLTGVNAGESLALGENTTGELAPLGPPDEWEQWNKERNDRIREYRESYPYLPDDLRTYSPDFDNNGRWVYTNDYGYCWTPTVGIGRGWAPYHSGRWIWRGGEYVWIGYEPWGWVPYHYGRWAFVVNIGWCWVPPPSGAVFWGPGYVGWVRTPDYVAWVPLAPGEIYYGRGYYGPHSVNITNMDISTIRIRNVYRNVYVNNGVTVVTHDTFITGRPHTVRASQNFVRRNLFARQNIRPGGPAIKPEKTSYTPVVKRIPHGKLPPARVRDIRINTLKKERPFVREPNRSVWSPGVRPKSLPVKPRNEPMMLHPRAGRPAPHGAREGGEMQPQERPKVETPRVTPAPRGEREMQPQERPKVGTPRVTPAPRGEREMQPQERPKVETPRVTPAPRGEREMQPQERPKVETPRVTPAPRGEREMQPQERPKVETPRVTPAPRREREMQPQERPKVETPKVTPAPKEEQEMKRQERPRPEAPKMAPPAKGVERKHPAAKGKQEPEKKVAPKKKTETEKEKEKEFEERQ